MKQVYICYDTITGIFSAIHDAWKENRNGEAILDVTATIYCERESHKGILIGKGGSMLRKIGQEARADLEDFFQIKVNLQCWVKVKEGWRNREGMIKNFGLE